MGSQCCEIKAHTASRVPRSWKRKSMRTAFGVTLTFLLNPREGERERERVTLPLNQKDSRGETAWISKFPDRRDLCP